MPIIEVTCLNEREDTMITLKEVTTSRQLKIFVSFPALLYKNHPYFVPKLQFDEFQTLDKKTNPAFFHCEARYWLAYKDQQLVGRIAAIINHHYIEKWKKPWGRFGYADFIEDPDVASALFQAAETWLKDQGMTHIHGPLGFCDLDPEGMLVEGFQEISTFTTIYNEPYYPSYLEKMEYEKDVDWLEYELTVPETPPDNIHKLSKWAMDKYHLRFPSISRKRDLYKYIPEIFALINRCYKDLYAVTELTPEQIRYYTKQYVTFFSTDFVKLIVNEKDELIAFGLALPSLSKAMQKNRGRLLPFGFVPLLRALRHNDRAELLLIGVDPEYQGKGVNAILLNQIVLDNPMSIRVADVNPQLESNVPVQAQWKHFQVRQNRRRRCYYKML